MPGKEHEKKSLLIGSENLLEWIKRGISFVALDVDYLYLVNSGKTAIESTIELYKNK